MRRVTLVMGLMIAWAGTLSAQDGWYLGSRGNGPEFGMLFRVGRQMWFEPGVYASVDRYHSDQDSSDTRGRYLALGLAGQLLWTGGEAVVTPIGGLRVSAGRSWTHQETDAAFSGLPYASVSDFPAWVVGAGVHAGVQIRLADRAALSFEYVVQGRVSDGTYESATNLGSPPYPPATSENRTDTEIWNSFTFTVRLFHARPASAPQ